jgi:DNA-binding transcriptional regulator YdaS (Cro superfamily)
MLAYMELKSFLATLDKAQLEGFARRVEVSVGHLRNVSYGFRPCASDLAVAIERESGFKVTRPDLRKDDWHRHWPELVPLYPSRVPDLQRAA